MAAEMVTNVPNFFFLPIASGERLPQKKQLKTQYSGKL